MPQDPGPGPDQRLEDELAQVQMLLERNRHSEAEAACRRLIERAPDNAAGHAALGDLHSARGEWNEAVDCYENALHLSFDPQVMERLAAARGNAIREGTASDQAPEVRIPEPRRRQEPARTQPSPRLVGAVAGGVLVITVAVFLIVRSLGGTGDEPSGVADSQVAAVDRDIYDETLPASPPAGATGMAGAPALAGPSRGATSPSATSAPVTIATSRPPMVSYTGRPAAGELQRPATRTRTRTTTPATTRDREILKQLRLHRQRPGGSAIRASAMALDDYSGLGILTLAAPATTDLDKVEAEILMAAYLSAATALRTESALNTLVVRCITRMPGSGGQDQDIMVFRASVKRATLEPWFSSRRRPTLAQIRNDILEEVWWDAKAVARYIQQQRELAKEKRE